uniref:Uncharacterized protein n=1 Tax=Megaselia scalaris TaxID=36166 RepID=T1GE81_MEGSC
MKRFRMRDVSSNFLGFKKKSSNEYIDGHCIPASLVISEHCIVSWSRKTIQVFDNEIFQVVYKWRDVTSQGYLKHCKVKKVMVYVLLFFLHRWALSVIYVTYKCNLLVNYVSNLLFQCNIPIIYVNYTYFPHPTIHFQTWNHPNANIKRHTSNILDVRSVRDANIDSDNNFVRYPPQRNQPIHSLNFLCNIEPNYLALFGSLSSNPSSIGNLKTGLRCLLVKRPSSVLAA